MTRAETLQQLCKRYGIALVYLFGSRSEQGYLALMSEKPSHDDPTADLDIGVVFRECLPPLERRYRIYADLSNALGELFHPYPVDLSFLEENHSVFQAEAIRGRCIYTESETFKEEYEEMILRRSADFKPVLSLFLKEVLEEALDDA